MPQTTPTPDGDYFRFLSSDANHAAAYPVGPRPNPDLYRPAAEWIGRLILPTPSERDRVMGTLMEVQIAPPPYEVLVGKIVRLRWETTPETNQRFWSVTRSVEFDKDAMKDAQKGSVLPERVDHWALVNPLESLSGAYPANEMIVRLPDPVVVEQETSDGPPILYLPREPIQTTGRFCGLARFKEPELNSTTRWRIVHYNRETGSFDGPEETVLLPETVPGTDKVQPAVNTELSKSPANDDGFYIYGALDAAGTLVVQSLMPRGLLRVRPQETFTKAEDKQRFLCLAEWRKQAAQGTFSSTLLCPPNADPQEELTRWQEGDRALVIHLYGKYLRNDWTWQRLSLTWGHFAFGTARVAVEPITGELHFDIEYHQVYVHGDAGIISGTHHWTRYCGDRQFGFLGTHPMQDVLLRLDCFTQPYAVASGGRSPLGELAKELEKMGARYRIADGRGGAHLSPSNNCSQDSNQALYAVLKRIDFAVNALPGGETHLAAQSPSEAKRVEELVGLRHDLRRKLLPLGAARADWESGAATIGSSLSENPLTSMWIALRTWHTMLPSVAVRHLTQTFVKHGATAWVLRTHQVGGHDETIKPCVPNV